MKKKYKKPLITTECNDKSKAFPAAVAAAFPALAGGVALGTQIKKALSGSSDLTRGTSLVDKDE